MRMSLGCNTPNKPIGMLDLLHTGWYVNPGLLHTGRYVNPGLQLRMIIIANASQSQGWQGGHWMMLLLLLTPAQLLVENTVRLIRQVRVC